MRSVSTSLTLSFSSDTDGGMLSMEVDGRPDGLNRGVTSFYRGDSPGILLFKSHDVTLLTLRATEGSVAEIGSTDIPTEEYLTCAFTTSASISKPSNNGRFTVTGVWGDALGTYTIADNTIQFSSPVLAVLRVEYTAVARTLRLVGASGDAPVIVFAQGVKT